MAERAPSRDAAIRDSNELLRQARMSRLSPSGSGRPMSRQELAEAVNAAAFADAGRTLVLDGNYVRKLEAGVHRWPNALTRQAFRAVLGAERDADLGFYINRGMNRSGNGPGLLQQCSCGGTAPRVPVGLGWPNDADAGCR